MNTLTRTLGAAGLAAALAVPAVAASHSPRHHHHHARHHAAAVAGTVASVDAAAKTVTVDVERAGRAVRAAAGRTLTFDVAAARLRVHDADGNGRDAGDVRSGDKVRVQLRRDVDLARQPIAARALIDRTSLARRPVAHRFVGLVTAVDTAAKVVTLQLPAAGERRGMHGYRRHARGMRAYRGEAVTISLATAKLRVPDRNGDGARDVADVATGRRAGTIVLLPRKLTGDEPQPFAARHLRQR